MPEAESNQALKIFLSYAREDERSKKKLLKHLSPLIRQGLVESWDDQQITAGSELRQETLKHFNEANIILCLISSDFISSDYCYNVEMQSAWKRREVEGITIVPILLRSVDWQTTLFKKLQAIPRNHKPIMDRSNKDKAFVEVAKEIEKVVNAVNAKNT